jgi:hypothetical protein
VSEFEGFGELKCPKPAIHIEYIKARRVPHRVREADHSQFLGDWCEVGRFHQLQQTTFQSICRLFVVRAYRNEFDIAGYETALQRFLTEVNITVKEIQALKVAA